MPLTEPTTAPIDPTARWHAVAAELREHAGQWRLVAAETSTVQAAKDLRRAIAQGFYVAFRPAGAYDAASSGREVKAIYIGPGRVTVGDDNRQVPDT